MPASVVSSTSSACSASASQPIVFCDSLRMRDVARSAYSSSLRPCSSSWWASTSLAKHSARGRCEVLPGAVGREAPEATASSSISRLISGVASSLLPSGAARAAPAPVRDESGAAFSIVSVHGFAFFQSAALHRAGTAWCCRFSRVEVAALRASWIIRQVELECSCRGLGSGLGRRSWWWGGSPLARVGETGSRRAGSGSFRSAERPACGGPPDPDLVHGRP